MNKPFNFLKNYLPLFFLGIILVVVLLPYYREGRIIAGGEGSYFLNFPLVWQNYGAAWLNAGTGMFATSLNFAFLPHLIVFQKIIPSERLVNFLMIFLIYFLPFLAVYLLCLELKLKSSLSFLMALFYLSNPFMINFLKSINQWNMLAAYILPSFFLIILKFYRRDLALFFFFGAHSLIFAFANANPPTMALYQIAIPAFVLLISIYKEKNFNLLQFFKTYLVVISSFLLFNFWWIINWFYIFIDAGSGYTKQFAISWLRGSGEFTPEWWKVINLANLLLFPADPDYDFPNWYYSRTLVPIIFLIPVLVFFCFLLQSRLNKKHHYILALMLVVFSFLAKGVNGLFGGIYEFMVMQLPLFKIFKSAGEKWGLLVVFSLTLYLIFGLKGLKKAKYSKVILIFLVVYVFYSFFAFTGDFIPDYQTRGLIVGSRRFLNKTEYKDLQKELNSDPENYRVLSLPGSWNYQVALQIEGNRFYTGNDPVLSNTNKPFLTPYSGSFDQRFGILFDKISHPDYLNLFGLYNIKKIVINKDMYPWFGFQEKESVPEIEKILDRSLGSSKNEVISLYDIGKYYLPRFYIPQEIIYSPNSTKYDMPNIVSVGNFLSQTAIFINPREEEVKKGEKFENDLVEKSASQILVVGDIQSAVDEAKLRAGVKGMNPGGVLFPYARWKPGSLIYPYILKKEEKIKNQFLDQPEKMLEQHLFFAAKRITEIQKWNKKFSDEQVIEVLARYKNEMQAAIKDLDTIRQTGEETFMLLAKIEVAFGAHQQRLLDVIEGDYVDKDTRIKLVKTIVFDIGDQLKGVRKKYSQIKYYFEVPQSGEYEILVEDLATSSNWQLENVTPGTSDKFITSVSGPQSDEQWLSFGKRYFDQGRYWLELIQPASQILLAKDWQKVETEIELDKENKFSTEMRHPTIYHDIKNWQPQTTYKLSFKYKTDGGKLKIFLVEEKGTIDTTWFDKGVIGEPPDKFNVLVEQRLESEDTEADEWWDFSIVVNSDRNTKTAKLSIGNEANNSSQTNIVTLKDVWLKAIVEPQIILKKIGNVQHRNVPKITFQKTNPTKYIINVENATSPYFLIFSESFHRGWKAYIKEFEDLNGETVGNYFAGQIREIKAKTEFFDKYPFQTWYKKPLSVDKHVIMNGYANSWYITPEDVDGQTNYQIVVEYQGQWLFYIGVGVTLITMIGSLGFYLLWNIKHAKKS